MTNGYKKLEEIHREIWEKSRQQEPFNQLPPQEIKKAIKQNAGLDQRTVKKYWNELQNLNKIEEVPRLSRWKIAEPEKEEELTHAGEDKRITIRVDKGLKDAADNLGINYASLMNKALAEQVSDLQNYVKELTGDNLSAQEADYAFKLLTNELYKKKQSQEAEARVDKQRRQLYKETFNKDIIESEDYQHLEKLRKKSWDIAESLGVQQKHG